MNQKLNRLIDTDTVKLFLFAMIWMVPVIRAEALRVDFGTPSSPVESGYTAYMASHEQAATFTSQQFNVFESLITVSPDWVPGADAAAMQMIVRGSGYSDNSAELLDDWIGTDTRQPGDPLTLTISGLPAGSYSWLSYHHDIQDQTGQFDLTIYDGSGQQTISNVDISNGGDIPFEAVKTLPATLVSNGTDEIRLEFTVISQNASVSSAFFVMNGFVLESNDPCYNAPPQIDGPQAILALAGKPLFMNITATDDGKPYIEGCDAADPQPGTAYPLVYQWSRQSGPGEAVFSPASADQPAVTVTFSLAGRYEICLDVSDAPAGISDGKTTRYTIDVEVVKPLDGDVDYNNAVNLTDLMILADQWLSSCIGGLQCADFDDSGFVTMPDFAGLSENWLLTSPDLVINEFVASNRQCKPDGDGNYPDWIELYNQSSEAIDLTGWFLTDDTDELQKWGFPAGTILPGDDYLVVYASDQDIDDYVDAGGYLHTNFALDKDGEYLALVSPDGHVIHEYGTAYPPQEADISYGIWYDLVRYFATPTPGQINSDAFLGFTDKPDYSVERGFHDQPFTLLITSETPGAFIRYSLDGSEPTEQHGVLYDPNVPLQIDTTTVVRSRSFKPGYRPGTTKTATYLFPDEVAQQSADPDGWPSDWGYCSECGMVTPSDYEMDARVVNNTIPGYSIRDALLDIPSCSIAMEPDAFISDAAGLWANPAITTEYKCSIEYIPVDGTKGFQEDCKIENHGGSSRRPWRMQKHNLRLTFTGEYGAAKLDYPLFPDSPVETFNQLLLRASFTDSWGLVSWDPGRYRPNDSQYTRDVWMKESFRDMGQPSSYGSYVHLYVNGLYFGVFNLTESVDEAFCAEHLGGEREDWVVGKDFSGVPAGWNTIMNTDISTMGGYTEALHYIDIDNFADYMLLHFYADAEDWPHHNGIAAANAVSGDGKLRFFVWDQEIVLDYHGRAASRIDSTGGVGVLFQKMRTSEEFRLLFADRVYKHCFNEGALSVTDSQIRYLKIADMLDRAIVAESARWGDTQMSTPYGSTIPIPGDPADPDHIYYPMPPHGPDYYFTREDSWIPERDCIVNNYIPDIHNTSYSYALINLLRSKNLYPEIDPPQFYINGAAQHGGQINTNDAMSMTNPNASGTIYFTLDGSDPRQPGIYTPAETVTLVSDDTTRKVLVPGGDLGGSWQGDSEPFDDSNWISGSGGVGYDTNPDYHAFIGIDVESMMRTIRTTCYIRIPFTVDADDYADLTKLTLRMRYDDGFIAYLNGTEIYRVNFVGTPAWNSACSLSPEATSAWISYTISDPVNLLRPGSNVLAIHGMNQSLTSSDFLIAAELEGVLESGTQTDPSISPTAIEYTGSFDLDKSTHIKARVKNGATWSALADTTYAVGPVAACLRISELMYHPADPNTEFIELTNVGSEPINLNLASFTKGIACTFGDVTLQPGQYTVVVENQRSFSNRYGSNLPVLGHYQRKLGNAGERLTLNDAAGLEIQTFTYDDDWHELTDGYGFSLTMVNPESTDPNDWSRKSGWRSSLAAGGTPGGAAQTTLAPGSIVINELLAHSHNADSDWIELHNRTGQDIHIGGWFLSDANSDPDSIRKYEIPPNTVIGASGYHVFVQDSSFGSLSQPPEKRFALSEGGETLYLYSGQNGQLSGFYQTEENFDASETDIPFGRYEKAELSGGYDFTRMLTATQGTANSGPRIPDIVITEIFYNPPHGADYEFVELHNRSDHSVLLMSQATTETTPGNFAIEILPWRLEGIGYQFPPDCIIDAGEYVVITKNPELYSFLTCDVYGPYDGKLDNAGEQIELQIPGDLEYGQDRYWIPIEKIDYDDESPWPTSPDGDGDSLHRLDGDRYGRDYSNWDSEAPTPGS